MSFIFSWHAPTLGTISKYTPAGLLPGLKLMVASKSSSVTELGLLDVHFLEPGMRMRELAFFERGGTPLAWVMRPASALSYKYVFAWRDVMVHACLGRIGFV
jgi:hypothetical protein